MIYLASSSPRRSTLLHQMGVSHKILMPADGSESVDESPAPNEMPNPYVTRLADSKLKAGWNRLQHTGLPVLPILAADTAIAMDNVILGKPVNDEDATRMLSLLSGRSHQVLTAIAMTDGQSWHRRLSMTEVWMRPLSSHDIDRYLATREHEGKAGSYAIQGMAARFIRRISGSPSGVMGLPIYETDELLMLFASGDA